jgi:hypothetical protein
MAVKFIKLTKVGPGIEDTWEQPIVIPASEIKLVQVFHRIPGTDCKANAVITHGKDRETFCTAQGVTEIHCLLERPT